MTDDFIRTPSLYAQLMLAARATLLLLVVCGLGYTGSASVLGGLLFPQQAQGSLIVNRGRIVGSSLVGQPFVSRQYFYARPSAANFDPRAAGGSNLAPGNPALRARVRAEAERIQRAEGVAPGAIPVDLLAASGSGLDPDISPAAARLQAARVASARKLPEAIILQAIRQHTQPPQWGIWGQARVNVLLLNLALDNLEVEAKITDTH